MIIVTYDFTDDKRRRKFATFLEKFGPRVQYSVFKVKNSKRILDNIISEVEDKYQEKFAATDSVYLIPVCEACEKKIQKYGSASLEDADVIYFD